MTDSTTASSDGSGIVPGWYTDPYDERQIRWWDGKQWTGQVAALPVSDAPQDAQTAPESASPAEPDVEAQRGADGADAPAVDALEASPSSAVAAPRAEAVDPEPLPSRRSLREAGTEYRAPKKPEPAAPVAEPAPTPEPVSTATPSDPLSIFSAVQESADEEPTDWGSPTIESSQTEAVVAESPALESTPEDAAAAPEVPVTPPLSAWDIPPVAEPDIPTAASLAAPEIVGSPSASTPEEAPPIDWGLTPRTRRDAAGHDPAANGATAGAPTTTPWAWLAAVSPLIAAVTVGYALASAGFDLGNWLVPAAFLVPYLLVLLFAVADRSGLVAAGAQRPAPWAWAALTAPTYLTVRGRVTRAETGRGDLLLIVWAICFVVAILGLVGYGLVSGHPLLPGLPG